MRVSARTGGTISLPFFPAAVGAVAYPADGLTGRAMPSTHWVTRRGAHVALRAACPPPLRPPHPSRLFLQGASDR